MLKKTMKMNLPMMLVLPAIAVLMGSMLCGCGMPGTEAAQGAPSVSVSAPAESHVHLDDEDVPASGTNHSTVRDRYENAKNGGSGNAAEPGTGDAMNSVSEVAELADIRADVEKDADDCFVYVGEDSHNPYDVVWDYGKDYQAYVDAVEDAGMWAVLFDADFYKESYPMLALQYHGDEALLLEHFQTVGVHEGRQASEAFNVAAYMENCSQTLRDAFGGHYECYYFYWALNQETESKVDTKSDGHPLQMTVKLTFLQDLELEMVNEYRAEVGVQDVSVDPEFLAFAGFRAQQDFTGDYDAHEWMRSHVDEIYEYLELIDADSLGENMVQGTCQAGGPNRAYAYYRDYYNSPSHYAAMVSGDYFYLGCSNDYWGPNGNGGYKRVQYDIYTDALSTYMNK